MRADRTVIVIGAFLFAIGLAVAANGYTYIEIERGWSLVIAGTVAFSTGMLLVGLGLILRELREISSSASKSALMLAKGRNPLASPETVTPAPPAPAEVAEPAPDDESGKTPTDWQADWQPEWEMEPAPREPETAPTPAVVRPTLELQPDKRAEQPLSWMVRPDVHEDPATPDVPRDVEPLVENLPTHAAEPHEPSSHETTHRVEAIGAESSGAEKAPEGHERSDWLYRTVAGPLGGVAHPQAEAETAHVAESEENTAHIPHEEAPVESAEPEERGEIIGHYDAHGAHYTMYADGSIDAETAHGVYRFASMEELKRFIEGES